MKLNYPDSRIYGYKVARTHADATLQVLDWELSDVLSTWTAMVEAAGEGTAHSEVDGKAGDVRAVTLDFHQFLVALHRVRPGRAVESGWLQGQGETTPKGTVV